MKATLAMAMHFHQPVGNFDDVMRGACDRCYLPFLDVLSRYPEIRMTLHFTGCLLEWVEDNEPRIIDRVRHLVGSGQVEIMSGGFYEPILVSIPEKDRLSQIRRLSEYVEDRFSFKPSGAWVAERVWEPSLASSLNSAGVDYIVLDDTHFLYAGLKKGEIEGYYTTEDTGKSVFVFPSDKVLRYHIPFKSPEECTAYMREKASAKGHALFVYGDDGEKFGEWPGTHKWVFEEKWLEKFFNELMANSDWLKTSTLSECLTPEHNSGRIYLPTSSYEEMLEWSLPADSQNLMANIKNEIISSGKEDVYKPFIRGGFWRNFFTKYPESDHMNKRVLYLSAELEKLKFSPAGKKQKNKTKLEQAETGILKAQCNCPYWHGVFGGLYLFHLRNAIYEHILKAEAILEDIRHSKRSFCEIREENVFSGESKKFLMSNRDMSLVVDISSGGTISEIGSKTNFQNYVNGLSRKKEAYHADILRKIEENAQNDGEVKTIHDGIQTADASLKEHMCYDTRLRHCFIDHFLEDHTTLQDLAVCRHTEMMSFSDYPGVIKNEDPSEVFLEVSYGLEGFAGSIEVSKKIILPLKGPGFNVVYEFLNKGDATFSSVFAPEFNFTMRYADSDRYAIFSDDKTVCEGLKDPTEFSSVSNCGIKDAGSNESLTLSFSDSCEVWSFPVRTVSQSEKAYELNYQCTSLVPLWKVDIKPGETYSVDIDIKLSLN